VSDNLRVAATERDSTREDLKEMTASRETLAKEKEALKVTNQNKISQLEADLRALQGDFEKQRDDLER
jgi:predicted  nucleic acid-binding Zn-ribbon protein